MERINVKLLSRHGRKPPLPRYQTAGAAAMDLHAFLEGEHVIPPGGRLQVPTGLAVEIPQGFAGLVFARSGLACKSGVTMANGVGLIDSDYRGEISVTLQNNSTQAFIVKDGDRMAQLMLCPAPMFQLFECAQLSDTERGAGGFGSTGVSAL